MSTSQQTTNESTQHAVDVKKLIEESVRKDLARLNPLSGVCSVYQAPKRLPAGECCIYQVPKRLRDLDVKAFTPQLVSIGPYHHGKKELKKMEDDKKRYLRDFLQWSEVGVHCFIELIEKNKTRLFNCYAKTINLSDKDFIKMILVDAAFIIMVLLKCWGGDPIRENDRIFYKPRVINHVCLDMCLLENQLPFFFLKDMLKLSSIINHPELTQFAELREVKSPIIWLTHHFFKIKWSSWVTDDSLETLIKSPKIEHFADFLRKCQQPSEVDASRKEFNTQNLPSVTELQHAGVTFKPGSSKNIFDIKFSKDKGILEIPQLVLDDATEILFRNLQAFEQSHCFKSYVSDYICFIGYLVDDPKDVKILVQNGIVDNRLPSAEAASVLFEKLEKENNTSSRDIHFAGVIEDLKEYRKRTWPTLMVTLKQNYFNNPWASISVAAAAFLFILTVTQTVISILRVA